MVFIAWMCKVASSSLCPPDRKVTCEARRSRRDAKRRLRVSQESEKPEKKQVVFYAYQSPSTRNPLTGKQAYQNYW